MNEGKSSQIFCLTWVKRNAAKLIPDQVGLTPEELQSVLKGGGTTSEDEWTDMDDSDETEEKSTNGVKEAAAQEECDDDLKEYNMDNYDNEEENVSGSVSGLVMFADNAEDPYITRKDTRSNQERNLEEDSDSEGEKEEKSSIRLKPDDNLLVCARCSEHSSVLEVYVYNHHKGDFYVHHDIPLMDTPLCMQWIGFDPGAVGETEGNLLAVGNLNSVIDIWDLDILNTLEPVFSIGKKKIAKRRKKLDFQHTDAILDLSWSGIVKDQLASASADTTVALWDLELGKATRTFRNHGDKVQTLEWKPDSTDCLLSGSFDGNVLMLDARNPKHGLQWSLDGEIERVTWKPTGAHYFVASNDRGLVYFVDERKPGSYVHKWRAHKEAIPGMVFTKSLNSHPRGSSLLFTASSDGCVKLWDLSTDNPTLIHERDMKMGVVHCCQGNPDEHTVVAVGGQKDNVKLWDINKTPEVLSYLGIEEHLENDTASSDVLGPEGGGGENDDDVLKYIEGEDYFNVAKLERLAKEDAKNRPHSQRLKAGETIPGCNGETKKKRRKKRKGKNTSTDVKSPPEVPTTQAPISSQKTMKKKRKKAASDVVHSFV